METGRICGPWRIMDIQIKIIIYYYSLVNEEFVVKNSYNPKIWLLVAAFNKQVGVQRNRVYFQN